MVTYINKQSNPSGEINQTATTIVYVVLALVLVALVAFIVWKIVKGKIIKKRANKAEIIKQNATRDLFYEYILSFQEIILFTKKELANFVVSVGKIKMNEIRTGARNLIMKLIKRDDFAFNFPNNNEYKTFTENCELLAITNCNLWDTKIPEVMEYFTNQYNSITLDNKKQEYLELVRKSIKAQFYNEK
ncbi:MHJ_0274 family protein [Metamycoplasma buccale]|uniref:MHJ_0274 family protein n=1 Tax=Metamycoplasma buccale TaxID=55602 RepID=UPI00398F89F8